MSPQTTKSPQKPRPAGGRPRKYAEPVKRSFDLPLSLAARAAAVLAPGESFSAFTVAALSAAVRLRESALGEFPTPAPAGPSAPAHGPAELTTWDELAALILPPPSKS